VVLELADGVGLAADRIVLAGDHLGPNTWRGKPADEAMSLAGDLVAAYAAAGYTKIHLDCSMACADDTVPMSDEVVAERSARLAAVAERAAGDHRAELVFVIGTEVPTPGGAHERIDSLTPTSPDGARATLAAHREAFAQHGLDDAWDRVIALVVQPGVEFDSENVVDYDATRIDTLRAVAADDPTLVFEAHSTDYQLRERLADLVRDHWAILKVGPGLTFALREAFFALASIEDELVPAASRSHLVETVDRVMVAKPKWWLGYYLGDDEAQRIARRYSYSDRLRYYWPDAEIAAAQRTLVDNLSRTTIPLALVSAVLPNQYARIRRGELALDPTAIAIDRVRDVLRDYSAACTPQRSSP
jgi:D-tagatose-1,6-bisphosphate aldolase subunit GatZ/KbaZ